MKKVTLDEWIKMSEKDRGINYRYLTDHEKFLVRTRYSPIAAFKISEPEEKMSEEEKQKNREDLINLLVRLGRMTQEEADKRIGKKDS